MKIYIDGTEVLCDKDITITEEMLSTSSVILNNVFPKAWDDSKDYTSNYYFPKDYSKCIIRNDKEITYEILGETTQHGTPTPDNPKDIKTKTGTIQERIDGKKYTFHLGDIELCQIGEHQDKIYKNSNGKWILHKEITKVVLNGSETNWYYVSSQHGFTLSNNFTNRKTNVYNGYCNYFQVEKTNTTWTNINYCGWNSNNVFWLKDNGVMGTSVPTLQTYLTTHNIIIYYPLANATDTEITDTILLNELNSIGNELLFAGVVKNTGNISLNPRMPHYANIQVLDFKTFLSESTTLDFVINDKTVLEAITTVINKVANYGFIVGNIDILRPNDKIGTYNTQNQTAYDVLQYLSEISGARWFTRMIDENQVAVDFYDPTLMPDGIELEYTDEFFEDNQIIDMTYNYSSSDYRNKQVIISDDVYADIEYTDTRYADGYQTQFNTMEKIGKVVSLTVNGSEVSIATTEDKELGITADFYYKVADTLFESASQLSVGTMIVITYIPLIEGRQIVYNSDEVQRIANQTNRNGVIARYESRNDVLSSDELRKVAQSYIDFKSSAEITLTIQTEDTNIWKIGDVVVWQDAPLDELKKQYMVKKKTIKRIVVNSFEKIFYTFELSSSYNSESSINYFDNQRRKATGNIQAGEFIERNIDIENGATIVFNNLSTTSKTITGNNALQCTLGAPLIK